MLHEQRCGFYTVGFHIRYLHVGHIGGEVQKNVLSVLMTVFWRLIENQEYDLSAVILLQRLVVLLMRGAVL